MPVLTQNQIVRGEPVFDPTDRKEYQFIYLFIDQRMSHNRHSSLNFVTQLHQKQKTKSLKNKNTTREAGKTIAYVAPFPSAKHTHCAAVCKKAYTCVCGEQTLCIFVDHFNCRSDRRHIRLHNDNDSPEDQTRR